MLKAINLIGVTKKELKPMSSALLVFSPGYWLRRG